MDGALVMVEHVVHVLSAAEQQGEGEEVRTIVQKAALEMQRPIFFSLLIIIAAYLPLFTLQRVERRLFTPMAFTVCYALLGALLISLTLIPVLATYMFRRGAHGWENPVLAWLSHFYWRVLRVTIRWSRLVVTIAAGIVIAGFYPCPIFRI